MLYGAEMVHFQVLEVFNIPPMLMVNDFQLGKKRITIAAFRGMGIQLILVILKSD